MQKIKVILTGATGMVGEGVLLECLQHSAVEAVLIIGRRTCGRQHPKLKEIIHNNFFDLSPIQNQLAGYDACFFCLGVSSIGMQEPQYYRSTHTLTLYVAETLVKHNTNMTFCYISGAGTDGAEKGRIMWARVKGKTENDLAKLRFKKVYNFRPGFLKPSKGQKNILGMYKALGWLYPVVKAISPKSASTLRELGLAMIHAASTGYPKQVLEVSDIIALAKAKE